jgi:hypothetical protein
MQKGFKSSMLNSLDMQGTNKKASRQYLLANSPLIVELYRCSNQQLDCCS